jgi:hypothetical protein
MKITTGSAVAALAFVFLCRVDAAPSEGQLAKEAKITSSEAEHIALSKVPNKRVSSGELEREHGTHLFLQRKGSTGCGFRRSTEVVCLVAGSKLMIVEVGRPMLAL